MNLMEYVVTWTCPDCGEENVDSYALTAFPGCSECFQSFFWDDLLTEQRMTQLNSSLEDQEDTNDR